MNHTHKSSPNTDNEQSSSFIVQQLAFGHGHTAQQKQAIVGYGVSLCTTHLEEIRSLSLAVISSFEQRNSSGYRQRGARRQKA